MELSQFPRPSRDNGRGVHWSLSVYEWGKRDWAFWANQLQAMKIKWVKIMDDGGGSGLRLARRLVDLEIMPVVRFYWPRQNPGNIGSRGADAVKKYLEAGVYYFETNNEPDLDLEWQNNHRPANWLDIVVDNFIIDADIILDLGGHPAMPAFGVGTQRDPFQKVVDRGRRDILDGGAWAALHNYCLGRPLEYPNDSVNTQGAPITEAEWETAGGLWAWEMGWDEVNRHRLEGADPDASIMTDSTCFRAFEHLNAVIVNAVGHSIPIMMTEGGYNVGQRAGTTYGDDARYPKPTPQRASELNMEMFRYMQGDAAILGQNVPDYYFASMPWLIAAYRIGVWAAPAENQGPWFTHHYDEDWGLNGELPVVQMLKNTPDRIRQDGPSPAEWTKPDYEVELGSNWDHRLKYLGVFLQRSPNTSAPYWKIVQALWRDEEESLGAGYIFVKLVDGNGHPIENATFIVARTDASDQVPTKGAIDGFWGNYAMYASLGTYKVRANHQGHPSETITALGLGREDDHQLWTRTSFRITFQLMPGQTPIEPEPVEPEPEPEPEPTEPTEEELLEALRRAALDAAEPLVVPIDRQSLFYQFAIQHQLGESVSDEFTFIHQDAHFRAQAFESGVVFAPAQNLDLMDFVPFEG
jgi:hypothetical protein